ncbi:hypothetical protein [Mycoplasma sp. ATU-Cv-508]|uniref:hypothetical protein n=1 Tax=Mycoplasma sp. ATU-Cv-508 TaxID=2048001 RepID=UPI000FDE5D8B
MGQREQRLPRRDYLSISGFKTRDLGKDYEHRKALIDKTIAAINNPKMTARDDILPSQMATKVKAPDFYDQLEIGKFPSLPQDIKVEFANRRTN